MSTTQKRATSRTSGGGSRAAKAEKKGREVDFHGLTLRVPAKLPTSFAYRFAKISAVEARGENATGDVYELLVGVIGEEQFDAVIAHVDTLRKQVGVPDLIMALINEYGSEPGNS